MLREQWAVRTRISVTHNKFLIFSIRPGFEPGLPGFEPGGLHLERQCISRTAFSETSRFRPQIGAISPVCPS